MKLFAGTIATYLMLASLCGVARSEPLALQTKAVNVHTEDDLIHRVGRLEYQGGLDLTSSDPRFGGLSGLVVSADGSRLTAVTDRGDWVQFAPALSSTGRLKGIADAEIGGLQNLNGKLLRKKRNRDAESLISIEGGFAVSFEHWHRLWLYRGGSNPFRTRPIEIGLPVLAQSMPPNAGIEALARLSGGKIIAIAEDFPKDAPFAQGWILKKNRWHGFRYRRHALFLPTGATVFPDGDLMVLERRFSYIGGFGTRLVTISPDTIKSGAEVAGREVARFEHPLITENFEGIASYRNAAGKTVIYLISDNNFLALQRTLLLKFILER